MRDISKAETLVFHRVDISVQVQQEEGEDIGWMLILAQSHTGNLLCTNSVLNFMNLLQEILLSSSYRQGNRGSKRSRNVPRSHN